MLEKPCLRSRRHIFSQIIMKLGQNLIKPNMKLGLIRSKTRSLGQILEKPCVCSRDQIFGLIPTKLGQSVCLDEILFIFLKMGHKRSKVGQIIADPILVTKGL